MPASDHDLLGDMQAVIAKHGGKWEVFAYDEDEAMVVWKLWPFSISHHAPTVEEAFARCMEWFASDRCPVK